MHRIYLDQNILSDMRRRKLEKSNNPHIIDLHSLCIGKNTKVIYSFTHFDEINQIKNEFYRNEHIQVLYELDGTYISSNDGKDEDISASDAWLRYLETNAENESNGVSEIAAIQSLIQRKLSGLPVLQTFDELHEIFKIALFDLLSENLVKAKDIKPDEVTQVEFQMLKKTIAGMEKSLKDLPNLQALSIPIEQQLGPRPFREIESIKNLDFDSLTVAEVIPEIDRVFFELNPHFNWQDYFSESYSDQISRCYSLMNWAGYHADDFDKSKKRKDRFMASHNDMMHVLNAVSSTHLISNDKAFLKKAAVCYSFLGSDIVVCDLHNAALGL